MFEASSSGLENTTQPEIELQIRKLPSSGYLLVPSPDEVSVEIYPSPRHPSPSFPSPSPFPTGPPVHFLFLPRALPLSLPAGPSKPPAPPERPRRSFRCSAGEPEDGGGEGGGRGQDRGRAQSQGELARAAIIYNPGLRRSATCQDDRVGISGQRSHPKRVSSRPKLKSANDLRTREGALNTKLPCKPQLGAGGEQVSALGFKHQVLPNKRAAARGLDSGVLQRLHTPHSPTPPIPRSPLRLAAKRYLCLDFVCCGRKIKVYCSPQDAATFYSLKFPSAPSLATPQPLCPGLKEAHRGRLQFRLLRTFGTPNPRPSRSRSPALCGSGTCSAPSGSRAGACALGADQPAGLHSGHPSVLPPPPGVALNLFPRP
ncbi:translation initiation factor IF-2-like [Mirounga leonina]|uniref:translation initiation factor IF-2-like n=1 Tax=Mirounga leonina TaxID=9715 RepID=UPI00156C45F7|nr:translation initiation factor IF-2-like [Mirounga leonina]